jgi:hypothetical protein
MKNVADNCIEEICDFQRIAFIIVYFGSAPWYFKFFNMSCAFNQNIDFILITDMDVSEGLANNVTLVKSSLHEISKRYTEKLGFEINITRPYKLCDLKPAYGLIFSDLIEGYDYWGFCDIDLVFGNIRSLITADILSRHEVITIKKEYIAGFFSLFRNNEKVNNLFKRSKDYRRVFQEPIDYGFDECNWEWVALMHGKDIWELNSEIESFTHVIKAAESAGDITAYWHNMEYHPGKITWNSGDLFYDKHQRVLLCHFIFFKDLYFKYVPKWKAVPKKIYINSFYFSKYAPGSLADRLLRSFLKMARLLKMSLIILSQYTFWLQSYLFARRKAGIKDAKHLTQLTGNYKLGKTVVNVFIVDDRLQVRMDGIQFPLWHKEGSKYVLAKCRFQKLINIEFVFRFDKCISAYVLQITGAGIVKYSFFKMP